MIVIFTDADEHNYFNDLKVNGTRIDCLKPFDSAYYINSYFIGTYRCADYVIAELERLKEYERGKKRCAKILNH